MNLDMLRVESIRNQFNVAVKNKIELLNLEKQEQQSDSGNICRKKWDSVKKGILQKSAREILRNKNKAKKKK